MQNWLKTAKSICYLRETDDFSGQKAVLSEIFGLNLFLHNKTFTQTPNGVRPKPTFRKGAESGFCLWRELRSLNQKIAHAGEDLDFYSELVGEVGLEPTRLLVI